jgi:hypothetical protein
VLIVPDSEGGEPSLPAVAQSSRAAGRGGADEALALIANARSSAETIAF